MREELREKRGGGLKGKILGSDKKRKI